MDVRIELSDHNLVNPELNSGCVFVDDVLVGDFVYGDEINSWMADDAKGRGIANPNDADGNSYYSTREDAIAAILHHQGREVT